MKIHVTPGVDARAAARDLLETGAVAIDDIGENLYDGVRDEIFEELGHVVEDLDIRTQRGRNADGSVFVLRNAAIWSVARARSAVLAQHGRP